MTTENICPYSYYLLCKKKLVHCCRQWTSLNILCVYVYICTRIKSIHSKNTNVKGDADNKVHKIMWFEIQTSLIQWAVATTFGNHSLSPPEPLHSCLEGNVWSSQGPLQGNQRAQTRLTFMCTLTHCSTLLDIKPNKTEDRNCHQLTGWLPSYSVIIKMRSCCTYTVNQDGQNHDWHKHLKKNNKRTHPSKGIWVHLIFNSRSIFSRDC